MVSINVEPETKKDFNIEKMKYCAEIKKGLNENEFIKIILEKFKERKK